MPRGLSLSLYEQGLIDGYTSSDLSQRQIALKLDRSRCAISNYLRLKEDYGKLASPGRPSILSDKARRHILRDCSNKVTTARTVRCNLNLDCSIRTVQRVIAAAPFIQREKLKRKPMLKPVHIAGRLAFAKKHMTWSDKWQSVIFSDEKRFCLDGPDGFNFYFHDLRKEELTSWKRQNGGGGLMVWGSFGWNNKSDLVFIDGKINSAGYTKMLDERFLACAPHLANDDYVFQQDNASIHVSKASKLWFNSRNITLLDWPSMSPDLSPMENMWGNLSRNVYRDGHQFQSLDQLKERICQCWEDISTEQCRKLINSMPSRIYEVILKNGKHTSY